MVDITQEWFHMDSTQWSDIVGWSDFLQSKYNLLQSVLVECFTPKLYSFVFHLNRQEEESNKNDSVPLYLRTSTTNSQLSESEMDLLVNPFSTADGVGSDEEEDIPLWADGNQEELDEDLEGIIEGKTLQFEESVLRSLRKENLID